MSFESLSHRYIYRIQNFPERWLPLIHLYDADLPLFPIMYFHVLPDNFSSTSRPGPSDRAFGYIERLNLIGTELEVHAVCNKDLSQPANSVFISGVTSALKNRLGFANPVTQADVSNAFSGNLSSANSVLSEIWHRVVTHAYGNILPFGELWDSVNGLSRWVASFYSPGGRKGELIQTHYFISRFGESIQSAGGIPQVDFYLMPTWEELTDSNNPLNLFPNYQSLVNATDQFHTLYCSQEAVADLYLSKFSKPFEGSLDTTQFNNLINRVHPVSHDSLIECFNAFDKGPLRTIIFLNMLYDIRHGALVPRNFTSSQCGLIYDKLKGFYQSSKVIEIYAQQCFGNTSAMPIDTWVQTFMAWPLAVYPIRGDKVSGIFNNSQNLGKVERLLWIAGQARKVHSSACDDALWCTKYSSTRTPRGANPLACKICLSSIRSACPAFAAISQKPVSFNASRPAGGFEIATSAGDNTTSNQRFIRCSGFSIYREIIDDFSPVDNPNGFLPFPQPGHSGEIMTVTQFIATY
jgi:hypothetical protein